MAQSFDPNAGQLTGEPRRIAGPVLKTTFPYVGFFSVSARGHRLVHLAGVENAGLSEMIWVDRQGNEVERTGITGDLYNPRLTRDGRRLAIDVSTSTTHGDIWLFDLARDRRIATGLAAGRGKVGLLPHTRPLRGRRGRPG